MTEETYWHIADPTYEAGEDLLCRSQLAQEGRAPEWKWDWADEGFDADVVCLFPDTSQGRVEADRLWSDMADHLLVRVAVPIEETSKMIKVEEGYPAVIGSIPEGWCTVVCAGYANVLTREGDECR